MDNGSTFQVIQLIIRHCLQTENVPVCTEIQLRCKSHKRSNNWTVQYFAGCQQCRTCIVEAAATSSLNKEKSKRPAQLSNDTQLISLITQHHQSKKTTILFSAK